MKKAKVFEPFFSFVCYVHALRKMTISDRLRAQWTITLYDWWEKGCLFSGLFGFHCSQVFFLNITKAKDIVVYIPT